MALRREGGAYSSWSATSQPEIYLASTMHPTRRKQICRGKNPPPSPETPQCFFSVVTKLSKKLTKEVVRMAGLLVQLIRYISTRPEIERVWLESNKLQNVLCTTVLNICYAVVSAIDAGSSVKRGKNSGRQTWCGKNPPSPPETCICLELPKLSKKLAKEVVRMTGLLTQCTEWMRIWLEKKKVQRKICLIILDVCSRVELATRERPPTAHSTTPTPSKTVLTSSTPTPSKIVHSSSTPSSTVGPSSTEHASTTERSPIHASSTGSKSNRQAQCPLDSTISKSNCQTRQASDSMSTQPSSEMQQPPNLWSKIVKKLKKIVNKIARKLKWLLMMQRLRMLDQELNRFAMTYVKCMLVFSICLLASKNIATISEKAVACQLLAVECKKAILRYNLPAKLMLAAALARDNVVRAVEVCMEAEKSYKLSEKCMLAWVKVQEAEKSYKLSEKCMLAWVKVQEAEKSYKLSEKCMLAWVKVQEAEKSYKLSEKCMLAWVKVQEAEKSYKLSEKCMLAWVKVQEAEKSYKLSEKCMLAWVKVQEAEKSYKLSEKCMLAWVKVQEAEKSYKLSEKCMLAWVKVQEAVKVAEALAQSCSNIEKMLLVIEKLTKGAKSP